MENRIEPCHFGDHFENPPNSCRMIQFGIIPLLFRREPARTCWLDVLGSSRPMPSPLVSPRNANKKGGFSRFLKSGGPSLGCYLSKNHGESAAMLLASGRPRCRRCTSSSCGKAMPERSAARVLRVWFVCGGRPVTRRPRGGIERDRMRVCRSLAAVVGGFAHKLGWFAKLDRKIGAWPSQ